MWWARIDDETERDTDKIERISERKWEGERGEENEEKTERERTAVWVDGCAFHIRSIRASIGWS